MIIEKEEIMVYTKIISENERGIFLGEERNNSYYWLAIPFGAMAVYFFWMRNFSSAYDLKVAYWISSVLLFFISFLGFFSVFAGFKWGTWDFLKFYLKENSFVICEVSQKKENCEIVRLEKIIDFSWDAQKTLSLTYLNDKGINQKIKISLKKKIDDSSFAYINRKMFDAVKLNK